MQILELFKYIEPGTVAEAIDHLNIHGTEAKILAGGLDLIPRMRLRKIEPEYIVNIQKISELDNFEDKGKEGLNIGALTTLRYLELLPVIQKDYSVLYESIHSIASYQVKTMGTVVGNIAAATPASDVVAALIALDAGLQIAGSDYTKVIPIENFFIGVGQTILQRGELITGISIPKPSPKTRGAFLKLVRTAADIAKVNVAVLFTISNDICQEARVVLGSVAPTAIRAIKAEKTLNGQGIDDAIIESAAYQASMEVEPITDIRSNAEYRRHAVKILVKRAIHRAIEKANL